MAKLSAVSPKDSVYHEHIPTVVGLLFFFSFFQILLVAGLLFFFSFFQFLLVAVLC